MNQLITFAQQAEIDKEIADRVQTEGYHPLGAEAKSAALEKFQHGFGEILQPTQVQETPKGVTILSGELRDLASPDEHPVFQNTPLQDCYLIANNNKKTVLSRGLVGVVIGDYGAYYEIADEDIIREALSVQRGEEYRLRPPYLHKVKYLWYTDAATKSLKFYYQKRGVTYADYRPNYWYVSVYEALPVRKAN